MLFPAWARYLLGALVAVLIALLVVPLIPAPGDTVVGLIAWVAAAACLVGAVLAALRNPTA